MSLNTRSKAESKLKIKAPSAFDKFPIRYRATLECEHMESVKIFEGPHFVYIFIEMRQPVNIKRSKVTFTDLSKEHSPRFITFHGTQSPFNINQTAPFANYGNLR